MAMQIRIYSLQIIRKKKLTSVSKQMEKLDGKITGSEGIGLTTVQRFVTEGAYVFFTGRCWTVDLKDRQIRVNAISPGLIDTSLAKKFNEEWKDILRLLPWVELVNLMKLPKLLYFLPLMIAHILLVSNFLLMEVLHRSEINFSSNAICSMSHFKVLS
jgi:hypothetical protein